MPAATSPALIALGVKRVTGARFLFDMRGLWADERVDGGLWPGGRPPLPHRQISRAPLAARRRPCRDADPCVGGRNPRLSLPRRARAADLGDPDLRRPRSLHHPGSSGRRRRSCSAMSARLEPGICSTTCCAALSTAAAEPGARLLVVNRNEQALIAERLAIMGSTRPRSTSALRNIATCRGLSPA